MVGRAHQLASIATSVVVLVAVNIAVFFDHWRGTSSFTYDFPMAYYAFTSYWITSLQHGEWPHWIPYQSFGYPAVLNPQLGLFYPPLWLFVVLGLPYSLHAANVAQVLHVLWGSLGFLFFARRIFSGPVALAGAVGFALFGGFFSNAQHPDIIRGFAWIPWIYWALLLRSEHSEQRVWRWQITSRMTLPNLCLPPILCCFVTGSYPGVMIAGLAMSSLFIVAQGLALARRSSHRVAFVDGALQFGAMFVGVGLAAAFLVPTVLLSVESAGARSGWQPWRLSLFDLFHLVVPSSLIEGGDYSMKAMLLPPVLLLFLPLARLRSGLLAPVAATSIAASVMCLDTFSGVSDWIVRAVPVLRLSRFPSGDYRTFIAIGLLTAALGGLQQAVDATRDRWKYARRIALLISLIAVLAVAVFIREPLPDQAGARLLMYGLTIIAIAAVAIGTYVWMSRWRSMWIHLVTILAIGFGLPSVRLMKVYWSNPAIEFFLYDRQGLPLIDADGSLRADDAFLGQLTRRPARTPVHPARPDEYPLIWRGYIDGSFMPGDLGGGQPPSRVRVEQDGTLTAIVMAPGQLRAAECIAQLCDVSTVEGLAVERLSELGRSLAFGRNEIAYEVDLSRPSLVIENEVDAAGWTAACTLHGERFREVRVNGALRGWVVPEGRHHLRVVYRTPWLTAGSVLSGIFFGIWMVALLSVRQSVRGRSISSPH